MKVKFLSKKQREELKQSKLNPPAEEKPQEQAQGTSVRISNSNNQMGQEKSGSPYADNMEHSDPQSQNERSREKRRVLPSQLTEQQRKQREAYKNKYLGLEKPEIHNRLKSNYKDKLLFEWEKSEDTSQGILNQYSREALKLLEAKQGSRADEAIGKTWREKAVQEMTERDWRIFREDMEIFIKGGRVAFPFREWHQNKQLSPELIQNLNKLKFQKPKPIQMQSIPIGLEHKDMVAIAPTGEGKTLGFLIPALHHVHSLPRITGANSDSGPHVIVLVPSRQLAEQIETEFQKIRYGEVTALRVVGGVQLDFQALDVQKGADILIGTPGRIKELMQKHYLSLSRCSWVVIDEADKMISENLIDDIEWILDGMGEESVFSREEHGKNRVTHMFSATMVPQIEKLTKKYLVAPAFVTIGEVGGGKKEIEQHVYLINESHKNDQLGRILRGLPGPIIIFVNSRLRCQNLVKLIENRFHRTCADYHGGKSQQSRQSIIQNFRNGKFQVLVATDLGGRGLDIKGISAAISYDAPKNISEFIHRAGRSGRAGVKGKAFTLLTNQDEEIFYDVRTFLERNDFKVPEQLREHPASQVKPGAYAQISRRKQVVYTN